MQIVIDDWVVDELLRMANPISESNPIDALASIEARTLPERIIALNPSTSSEGRLGHDPSWVPFLRQGSSFCPGFRRRVTPR